MRLVKAIPLLLPLLWASPALADRQCQDQPAPVRAYLAAHPEWSLLRYDDLPEQARPQWKADSCPGFTGGGLAANGKRYFALALLARRGNDKLERIVFLSPVGISPPDRILDEIPGGRFVVMPALPGHYADFNPAYPGGFRHIVLSNPLFYVTNTYSSSWVYYFKGEQLTKVVNQE